MRKILFTLQSFDSQMNLQQNLIIISNRKSSYDREWLEKNFAEYKSKVQENHKSESSEPFDPLKIKFDWGRVRIALSHIPIYISDISMTAYDEDEQSNQIIVYYELESPLPSFEMDKNLPFISSFVAFSENLESTQTFLIDPEFTLNRIIGLSG
jgi:hypothetical protein